MDAVICVAGGWAGGNAKKGFTYTVIAVFVCIFYPNQFTDLIKTADLMWRQSVWSSLISTSLAASHLKAGGILTLTGAKAALEGTPGEFYFKIFMLL